MLPQFNFVADRKDRDGRTPLWLATHGGQVDVVPLLMLLRPDVDANSADGLGETPLSRALKKGNRDLMKLLLERSEPALKISQLAERRVLHFVKRFYLTVFSERKNIESDTTNFIMKTCK
jgi:ankyrin repeat protein